MDSDPSVEAHLARTDSGGYRARTERFPVQVPVHCRVAPFTPWHLGEIENISATGVLFRSSVRLGVDRRIEMSFTLNGDVPGIPAAHVVCEGRVVRAVSRPDGVHAFGVAIEQRHFVSEANS